MYVSVSVSGVRELEVRVSECRVRQPVAKIARNQKPLVRLLKKSFSPEIEKRFDIGLVIVFVSLWEREREP